MCSKAGQADEPTQAARQEESLLAGLSRPFVLFRLSADWMRFPKLGREICFAQSTGAGVNLVKNALMDTLRNNFVQVS